jgi:hypothetical protein
MRLLGMDAKVGGVIDKYRQSANGSFLAKSGFAIPFLLVIAETIADWKQPLYQSNIGKGRGCLL